MKLSEAKKTGFFRVRINIGQFFEGCEENDVFVTLREPTYAESRSVGGDEATADDAFIGLLPSLLTDHNFEKDNGGAATAKEVIEVLQNSTSALVYVVQKWKDALPLTKLTAGSSGKSDGSDSKTASSPGK